MRHFSDSGWFELLSAKLHYARGDLDLAQAHLRSGLAILADQLTVNVHRVRPELELLLAELLWARSQTQTDADTRAEARMWARSARDQLVEADSTIGRATLLERAQRWLDAH